MADNSRANMPACPKVERLEELMDWLTEQKDQSNLSAGDNAERNQTLQEVITALDWTHTMLSNRKTYQKKNQLVKKARYEAVKGMLSKDELDEIDRQVERELGNL